jgi:hypothetical protein
MGSETRSIPCIQCTYERGLLNKLLLSKGAVFIIIGVKTAHQKGCALHTPLDLVPKTQKGFRG